MREAGHEVCCHGWRWEDVSRLPRDVEREHMLRAIASIERTCGERPRGWYCKAPPSLSTRELLVEEGGFEYDSDSFADDLPYYVEVLGAAPPRRSRTRSSSTTRSTCRATSSRRPSSFLETCVRAFDYLWDEGATHPRMLSVGLHPRWIGQPSRASALREFIEHCQAKGGAWFARRIDIARWWNEHAGELDAG